LRSSRWARAVVVAGAALQLVATAAAQTPETPRFSVAAGVGGAVPFDSYEGAISWHVSGRIRTAKPVSIEVTFDRWLHESTRVRKDVTLYGRGGIIGHADEVRTDYDVGVSVLSVAAMVRRTVGRATVAGSIGPALVSHHPDYRQMSTGCSATTPESCEDSSSSQWKPTLGVHGAFDVGFRMTSRLSPFARVNLSAPVYRFPGSGHFNFVGGVRVELK
jgi:hypothetical protein